MTQEIQQDSGLALSPRERRHQRTRTAILDAARQIINAEGTDALSMRAIAERIDYSPAGLYEYFGGKEEIIEAVCQQGHRRLKEAMERVDVVLGPAEFLMEIGIVYIQFAMTNPDYFLLMFTTPTGTFPIEISEEVVGQPPTIERDAAENLVYSEGMLGETSSFVVLVNTIQQGIDAGVFHPRPGYGLMEMAYSAWALVHGMAMLRITHLQNFPVNLDRIDRETLLTFGNGLRGY